MLIECNGRIERGQTGLISFVALNCYIPLPSIVVFLSTVLCSQLQSDTFVSSYEVFWVFSASFLIILCTSLLRSEACWGGFDSTNCQTILGWCPNSSMTLNCIKIILFGLHVTIKKQNLKTNNHLNIGSNSMMGLVACSPNHSVYIFLGTVKSANKTAGNIKIMIHFQQTLCICYTLLECQQRLAIFNFLNLSTSLIGEDKLL